jgi:hypothetical protein
MSSIMLLHYIRAVDSPVVVGDMSSIMLQPRPTEVMCIATWKMTQRI